MESLIVVEGFSRPRAIEVIATQSQFVSSIVAEVMLHQLRGNDRVRRAQVCGW